MLFNSKIFVLFSVIFVSAFQARADILFAPGLTYTSDTVESSGVAIKEKRTSFDLRLGSLMNSGLFVGGTYVITTVKDNTGEDELTAGGPTLGFAARNGFYVFFTYFLFSEYELRSNPANPLVDGMGPQVDVGWAFPLTSTVYIGPQITYRSISFDKFDDGTAADYTNKNISPYLALWVRF